jgi:hypothetical protein
MPNAYMTKMANAKKQNLASFTYTGADKITRTYKRIKVGGLVTYKCVGENCKPKRKKSRKKQRKKLATAAAKAARTRSKRMSAKKRAAAKAARDKKKHNVGIRQAARKRSARVKKENRAANKRSRRVSKKSKECGIGERYVRGKGCVLREQSQFSGKFMTGFGGGKRKIRVGPRGGRYVLKGGKKVYL